jgi:hypothetical protein
MAKQTKKNEMLELKHQIKNVTSILNDINLSIDVMNKEGIYNYSIVHDDISALKLEAEIMLSKYNILMM